MSRASTESNPVGLPSHLVPSLPRRPDGGEVGGWRVVDLPERGTTFAYDRPHASRSRRTVVLLHGWTATGSLNWTATIAALEEHYRVIALDHRGHGRGIQDSGPFSLEECADDVAALIAALGVRRAIFVGYSMGGPVAQLIWRRHRHLVDGLVLCATAADFTSTADEPWLRVVDRMWRATGAWRRSTAISKQVVRTLLAAAPVGNEFLEATARHDDDAIHGAGLAIARFCSTAWISAVDVPVVVIVTLRDRLVRPAQQWQLAELIPRARTIALDAGHLAPFRQPELIATAVAAGCDSIARPTIRSRLRRMARLASRWLRHITNERRGRWSSR
jgi:pimeloyl-ACP methyl ester carboxylesterase